jgi:hypothetical protein
MEQINNLFSGIDESVNNFLNNKYIYITTIVLVILFGSLTASRLARNILYLLDNPLSRLLMIGFIYYISTKNVPLAILMLTALVISVNTLNKHRSNILLISILRNNLIKTKPNRYKMNKLRKLIKKLKKMIRMKANKKYKNKKLTPKIKTIATKAQNIVNSLGDVTIKNVMDLIKSYEMEKTKNKQLSKKLSEISGLSTSSGSPSSPVRTDSSMDSQKIKTQIIFPKVVTKKDNLEKFVDYSDYSLF